MNGNIRQCFKNGSPLKPFGLKQNYGNPNLVKSCRYKEKKNNRANFVLCTKAMVIKPNTLSIR
jgi:hypothetical protein